MRRPLVAGNWKMHGSKESVNALLDDLKHNCERVELAELVVLAPFVFLPLVEQKLLRSQISWGAQNLSEELQGAFTGEVSAAMLLEFNCTYALVGHSERRALYHEGNAVVAKKFFVALAAGLTPILCVGETEAERNQGKTLQIIQEQLEAVLELADNHDQLCRAVIAYEPVWAIGTGKQASPEQAQEVHAFIRGELTKRSAQLSNIRIVYGGSVKPDNAAELFAMPDIDGGLIGGASLDAESFLQIGVLCGKQ